MWAAGNGGRGDSCAVDGYASSIYTIAVGTINQNGVQAYFDECCTSKMAVTFSHNSNSDITKENQIVSHCFGCKSMFIIPDAFKYPSFHVYMLLYMLLCNVYPASL